jgi:hypothetical protein
VGGGHWSPVVAYSPSDDRFLLTDVSRYKYPPVSTILISFSRYSSDSRAARQHYDPLTHTRTSPCERCGRALHLSHLHKSLTTSDGSMGWITRARVDAAIHVAPLTNWFLNFNSKLKRLPLLPTLTFYSHSLLTPCTVLCVWSASRTLSRSCYNISPRIPCMARSCG